jgi:hypothetical protein
MLSGIGDWSRRGQAYFSSAGGMPSMPGDLLSATWTMPAPHEPGCVYLN